MSQSPNSSQSTSVGRIFTRSLRLFWFFLKVGVGILALLWLSQIPGHVTFHVAGLELQVSLSFSIAASALGLAVMWLVIGVLKGMFGMTSFWKERRLRKHRKIADACLENGLYAFFAEDYKLTITQLRRALKYDPARKGVFEGIMGVAALNNDQHDLARDYFEDLVKDPGGRFMGYFGLYHLDKDNALPLLERAIAELPDDPWVITKFREALGVVAKTGQLDAIHRMQSLTDKLYDLKAITKPQRSEQRGETLWLLALYHKKKEDLDKALECARESYELSPGLAGPVIMLAECQDAQRAQKLLMKAFAVHYSPKIAEAITRLLPKTVETFHVFEQHFEGHTAPQVTFLLALLAFYAKLWGRSRQLLATIPKDKRDGHYHLMLAQLADAEHDVEAVKKHSETALLRVVR